MKSPKGPLHWIHLFLSSALGLFLLRAMLAAVWFAACKDKLMHPRQFRSFIERYEIPGLEGWPLLLVTLTVPVLELILGLLLVTGFALQGALILTAGLMLAFVLLIGQAKMRGIDITNCGCFSLNESTDPSSFSAIFGSMGFHIVFDLFLMFVAIFIYWKVFSPSSKIPRHNPARSLKAD